MYKDVFIVLLDTQILYYKLEISNCHSYESTENIVKYYSDNKISKKNTKVTYLKCLYISFHSQKFVIYT